MAADAEASTSASSTGVVSHHRFTTPHGLLDALRPRNALWSNGNPERWIFRGIPTTTYELLPSAHRAGPWTELVPGGFDPAKAEEHQRLDREKELIQRFYKSMSRAALPVPGDSPFVRDAMEHGLGPLGNPNTIPVLAIAQHYGVPTRLLDWTRRAIVAAYFAATELVHEEGCLAVWALNATLVQQQGRARIDRDLRVSIESASGVGNPNLHAQGGCFTLCRDMDNLRPLDIIVKEELFARQARGHIPVEPPLMRRLTLPRTEAKALLRLLYAEGVSALSVFPDLSGVKRHLRESVWCERSLVEPF
jgi:hypothetical protein